MPQVTLHALWNQLSEWVRRVHDTGEDIEVEVDGEPVVVLVDKVKYESMVESIEVLSDPRLLGMIGQGLSDLHEYSLDQVEEMVYQRAFPVATMAPGSPWEPFGENTVGDRLNLPDDHPSGEIPALGSYDRRGYGT
ncbi:hypothetical protein Ahu01nite_080510 [Winogradskya humida]|uniref:Antitoxin n=1 Tax=Winogradskya humida TaxID=113566 RepID=A0ABQ4A267_9ACTN|nr:hypothetical protein Ahu01nite_080510 [Actinoplanes humidus]